MRVVDMKRKEPHVSVGTNIEPKGARHSSMPMRVSAVSTRKPQYAKTDRLTTDVRVQTARGERILRAQIDSAADANLIGATVAKELGLTYQYTAGATAEAFNGSKIYVYGECEIEIAFIGEDKPPPTKHHFVVVDMPEYDMMLGHPWLAAENPQVDNWAEGKWRARYKPKAIEIVDTTTFKETIKNAKAYALLPTMTTRVLNIRATRTTPPAKLEIPTEYMEWAEVFSEAKADELPNPEQGAWEHAIDTDEGKQPPYGPVYNLSETELVILREYIEENLKKRWIRRSTSPAGAPIFFVPKQDGTLRLCVDYRGLNDITIKNRHPLPLISETLDRMRGARIFTKLDLRNAYHRVRIKRGHEWKTAFRTRYGHFEYLVMPFGLANAPATFQALMNETLAGLLDTICVVYLDDILVFSKNPAEHKRHVGMVLERLRAHGLYAKLSKCEFNVAEVDFLGYVISANGVAMEKDRITSISEWPEPASVKEVQVFLGFANFYRRFIEGYSRIVHPITNLLKTTQNATKPGGFKWTQECQEAFDNLKRTFTTAPILVHFDPEKPIRVETDASGFAIAGILSQPKEWPTADGATPEWHPVAFYSRKMDKAELNYETHDQELLAIIKSFEQWRHYLEGSRHPVTVMTDHNNLKYFMTTSTLTRRQARWAQVLSAYDFVITYRPGRTNPADGPSRRPDYQANVGEENLMLPTLQQKLKEAVKKGNATCAAATIRQLRMSKRTLALLKEADEYLAWAENPKDPEFLADVKRDGAGEPHVAPPNRKPEGEGNGEPQTAPPPRGKEEKGTGEPQEMAPPTDDKEETTAAVTEADIDETVSLRPLPVEEGEEATQWFPRAAIQNATSGETTWAPTTEALLDLLKEAQKNDPLAIEVRNKIHGNQDPNENWSVDGHDVIRYQGAAYIPPITHLRQRVLELCHDAMTAGHLGQKKTLELVKRKYYWPKMAETVSKYVASCDVCQRSKAKRHSPYGEMQPLPKPERMFESITMDFITGLPPSMDPVTGTVYDMILVIVDRYSKVAQYIPCRKDDDADNLAKIFTARWFKDGGLPRSIVTDRGSVFTSQFWAALCYHLDIKRRLSTAYHPQTDGQTERQNQTLETYLRTYINHHQDDWVHLLPLAEFAYNNAHHDAIGTTPNRVRYGQDLEDRQGIVKDFPQGEVPAAKDRATMMAKIRKEMEEHWEAAKEKQAKYYNKKHTPLQLNEGEYVMLSSKNLATNQPSKKLGPKLVGPFEVIEKVGKQAYRLRLPKQYQSIHNVFHISLLEPYQRRDGTEPPPPPEVVEGEERYVVEKILDHRVRWNREEYLVKWEGYSQADNMWLKASDFTSDELTKEYHEKNGNKRRCTTSK